MIVGAADSGMGGPLPTWEDFYRSDLQGLYALLVVPALFLVYLRVAGRRGAGRGAPRFVFLYCLVFTVQTLLDPIATGPLVRGAASGIATAVALLFVLLGDFRVFILVFSCVPSLSGTRALAWAAALAPAVAVTGFAINAALDALAGPLSSQVLWLSHELVFVAVTCELLRRYGGDAFLRRCLLYVLAYYALWALSDVLILLGVDAGWQLRIVPNQLYYALWTPAVWLFARAHPPDVAR